MQRDAGYAPKNGCIVGCVGVWVCGVVDGLWYWAKTASCTKKKVQPRPRMPLCFLSP